MDIKQLVEQTAEATDVILPSTVTQQHTKIVKVELAPEPMLAVPEMVELTVNEFSLSVPSDIFELDVPTDYSRKLSVHE